MKKTRILTSTLALTLLISGGLFAGQAKADDITSNNSNSTTTVVENVIPTFTPIESGVSGDNYGNLKWNNTDTPRDYYTLSVREWADEKEYNKDKNSGGKIILQEGGKSPITKEKCEFSGESVDINTYVSVKAGRVYRAFVRGYNKDNNGNQREKVAIGSFTFKAE